MGSDYMSDIIDRLIKERDEARELQERYRRLLERCEPLIREVYIQRGTNGLWDEVRGALQPPTPAVAPCGTCGGKREVLHVYSRGPGDAPGNRMRRVLRWVQAVRQTAAVSRMRWAYRSSNVAHSRYPWRAGEMRDPARIDRILLALRARWMAVPDLRLGQLLVNVCPSLERIPYFIEDDVVEAALGPSAPGEGQEGKVPKSPSPTPPSPVPVEPPRTPAVCTHPSFDVDGKCHTCGDEVALAVPVEFARRVAEIQRAAEVGLPPPVEQPLALVQAIEEALPVDDQTERDLRALTEQRWSASKPRPYASPPEPVEQPVTGMLPCPPDIAVMLRDPSMYTAVEPTPSEPAPAEAAGRVTGPYFTQSAAPIVPALRCKPCKGAGSVLDAAGNPETSHSERCHDCAGTGALHPKRGEP